MPSNSDHEGLSELIGAYYDAVIDPAGWQAAIDRTRLRYGFHLGAISVVALPRGEAVVQASSNIPDAFLRNMGKYNNDVVRMWGGPARMAMLPIEEPIITTQATDRSDWEGNPFYEEWCRPQDLVEQVAIMLARDQTMVANIALGLQSTSPPLTEATMDELRLLAPHIRRAVTISRVLDVAVTRAATFEEALEASPSGVVLVDPEMKMLHANGIAESMLLRGDPIRSVGGRLTLRHELAPGQLAAAVGVGAADEGRLARRGIGIPARLRDGSPRAVHVMPLVRRSTRGGRQQRAAAAVFVADSGAGQADLPADQMGLLYGLTPAEQRVFELVVRGRSTDKMAKELGVAPSTLRTHLLHVFEKTGKHSRAELTHLSREFALPG